MQFDNNAYESTSDVNYVDTTPQQSIATIETTKKKLEPTTTKSPKLGSSTTYNTMTLPTTSSPKTSTIGNWISDFNLPSVAFDILISLIISILAWLAVWTIVGSEALPGGSVFVIIFLEFGGRILGYLVSLCHLPPMVGMLGLGIFIRNVPYFDFGKHLASSVASPIRQLSLAIILTRAGLGLDLDVLLKFKWLIARLAFFPTVIEASCTGILIHFLLDFPWLWSLIVGFVIAAVSPAVIVPRILELKEKGYGVDKGIPTIILASASLDNIVSIALFGVVIGFTFSTKSLAMTILQGPLEILIGCGTGIVWGFFAGMIFPPSYEGPGALDHTVFKFIMLLGGGVSSVLGYNRLGYSGAGVLSCLISAFMTACLWKKRNAMHDFESIRWSFTFAWKFFEPLLFGVIGCQMDLLNLGAKVLGFGLICLICGAMIRFGVTFLMVCKSGLSLKEKLFVSISWIAKATVQAAIGPMALDLAQKSGSKEEQYLGQQVLNIAVLVILLTAPIGELGVIIFGPRFLKTSNKPVMSENDEHHNEIHVNSNL